MILKNIKIKKTRQAACRLLPLSKPTSRDGSRILPLLHVGLLLYTNSGWRAHAVIDNL